MLCLQCGYSLQHLPAPRCPECGRPFDPADPSTFAADKAHLYRRTALRFTIRAGIALLIVLTVYVGGYYALVRLEGPGGMTGAPPWRRHVEYPFGGESIECFFAPMAAIDRTLRPRAWQYWGFAAELVPAYEFAAQHGYVNELQDDADVVILAILATWFVDEDVGRAREALSRGEGTGAELDAAIARRGS